MSWEGLKNVVVRLKTQELLGSFKKDVNPWMKMQPFIKSTRDGRQSSLEGDWEICDWRLLQPMGAQQRAGFNSGQRTELFIEKNPRQSIWRSYRGCTRGNQRQVQFLSPLRNFTCEKWVLIILSTTIAHERMHASLRFLAWALRWCLLPRLGSEETNAIFWISKSTLRPFCRVSACCARQC